MYLLHRKKNGIYANISLFLSYSEVTVATRSSLYPDEMVTAVTRILSVSSPDGGSAPRDDLCSPECQRKSGQLDEPQRQIPVKTLSPRRPSGQDHENQMSPLQKLFRLARGELPPRLSLVSPKIVFSILSQMEFWFLATVASGLLSWGHLISSDIVDLIAQILLELN